MAVKKRWHITLTSTESPRARSLTIPKNTGIVLISLITILLAVIVSSTVYAVINQSKIIAANQIIAENELLKSKIDDLTIEIDSILTKLKLMEQWEDEIRSEKKLKPVNKDVREMGMGGIPQVDTTFITSDSQLNLSYNLALNQINQINSKLNFDLGTHKELLEKVKLKESLFLATPSIYPTYGRISDGYGWRTHPITNKRSFHHGIDFGNKTGTPIYATADGVIKKIQKLKLMGNMIVISHNFGYETRFGHLSKALVKVGQEVKRGDIIALMGNSGRSTGAHLHYEVLRYNKHRNPYSYLNKMEDDILLTSK